MTILLHSNKGATRSESCLVDQSLPFLSWLFLFCFWRLAAVHVTGFMDPAAAVRLGAKLKRRDAADAAAGGAASWEVANGRGMESSGKTNHDGPFFIRLSFVHIQLFS